jgi:hypothetical protein
METKAILKNIPVGRLVSLDIDCGRVHTNKTKFLHLSKDCNLSGWVRKIENTFCWEPQQSNGIYLFFYCSLKVMFLDHSEKTESNEDR